MSLGRFACRLLAQADKAGLKGQEAPLGAGGGEHIPGVDASRAEDVLGWNPRHPGLKTHEYHSIENPYDPDTKVFEVYVQNRTPGAYRVFWCYGPKKGEITIIAITPHP